MDRSEPHSDPVKPLTDSPDLESIYRTAPIGLAFLDTNCRYVMIKSALDGNLRHFDWRPYRTVGPGNGSSGR